MVWVLKETETENSTFMGEFIQNKVIGVFKTESVANVEMIERTKKLEAMGFVYKSSGDIDKVVFIKKDDENFINRRIELEIEEAFFNEQ